MSATADRPTQPVGAPGDTPRVDGVRLVVTLVAVAVAVAQGFGRFVFPALLPAMKRDLLGSYSAAGFLGTANVAAYLVGALVVMVASLRRPPHHIVIAGLAASTSAMVLLATAQGFVQLVAGMALAGLGGAAVFIPAPGIVGAAVGRHRRGVAVGVLNAGLGGTVVLGTQLSRFAPSWWGPSSWRGVWAIMAAVTFTAFVANARWLRPRASGAVSRPKLSALRSVRGWKSYLAGYFAFGFGYILLPTYMVAALRDEGGFGVSHAANVYVLLGLGIGAGGVTLGKLSDRVGRPLTLLLGYGSCAVCPLVMLTYRQPFVAIAAFSYGLLFSGCVATVAVHAADSTDPADTAAAFALATVAFSVAQAFGPQVGGVLIDRSDGGFTTTFVTASVVLAGCALSALMLWRASVRPASPAGAAEVSPNPSR